MLASRPTLFALPDCSLVEFIPDQGSAAADTLGSQSTVLGGGRYDGLIESLGGAPAPGVGWAAGIERLAMLVGTREEPMADAVVVVENEDFRSQAIQLISRLREAGFACELFASGSPRKRFDKAKKISSHTLVSFPVTDAGVSVRVMGDESETAKSIEQIALSE